MAQVTIGGNRLGSGKKMKVWLHNYERSTHDLSRIMRTTMSPGTLVPFFSELGLPGDTFDIELNADVKTLPTIGPLFGSFKLQMDVFVIPFRLYQAQLHNNDLGIGMNMASIKLPQLHIIAKNPELFNNDIPVDISQINPSSLLSYLGVRGLGYKLTEGNIDPAENVERYVNAIKYLGYWDIYKNYYANKQEKIGAFISVENTTVMFTNFMCYSDYNMTAYKGSNLTEYLWGNDPEGSPAGTAAKSLKFKISKGCADPDCTNVKVQNRKNGQTGTERWSLLREVFTDVVKAVSDDPEWDTILCYGWKGGDYNMMDYLRTVNPIITPAKLKVETFNLENVDTMRTNILKHDKANVFVIDSTTIAPYGNPLQANQYDESYVNKKLKTFYSQVGLALKTYQSDIFNNWMDTELFTGEGGINEITAISTTEDFFTLDTLNLAMKVYKMLNRIAISGGTYYDWIEAVYSEDPYRTCETPMYVGGLSKEVVFQEVVNLANTSENPAGELRGRGVLNGKHKGGKIYVKVQSEPCYIMGIMSLTPRIDYSQGNDWDVNLKTMDDLHKPGLDQIGFQDLVTDKMAWWSTEVDSFGNPIHTGVGKQPAWLDYMTSYNRCYGDFADANKEMFMTLNRRYTNDGGGAIQDLTTYIDPTKFNYMFAETKLDAQNFWVQVAIDCEARRKMSAKIMPNL